MREQYFNLSDFGNFPSLKMWLNKKRLINNKNGSPTAKFDGKGNLVCNKNGPFNMVWENDGH